VKALAIALSLVLMQQTPTFRSRAEVVTVPVSVTTGNRPVTDLRRADFEVFDNGVGQTFDLSRLDDLPLDVTILLDTSASVKGAALDSMKRDVEAISAGLRAGDRLRILGFSDDVETLLPFTPAGTPVRIDRIDGGGATSLYSALAASLIVDPGVSRPQLVFALTDGRDNASLLDSSAVLALAGHSSACLYLALVEPNRSGEESLLLRPRQTGIYENVTAIRRTMGPYAGGPNVSALRGIAARTGGAVYADTRRGTLPDLFRVALADFRSGYLLTFTPSTPDTGWHEIAVSVKGRRYTVRARKGYDGS